MLVWTLEDYVTFDGSLQVQDGMIDSGMAKVMSAVSKSEARRGREPQHVHSELG